MSDMVREWYETKKNVDEMNHSENPRLKHWERYVASYFPTGARILDVGCGLGREAFVLTDMGFTVTAIDISSEVISRGSALSSQKGYSIPFILYDGHTLPFSANSFDVVIIWSQTFGIMYGDEYKREFLSECKRVLSEDGFLSFSGHDYNFLKENYSIYLKSKKFYPYADTEVYWEAFEAEKLKSFAQNAGLKVILCEQGENYKPEDGPILHCLCRKQS